MILEYLGKKIEVNNYEDLLNKVQQILETEKAYKINFYTEGIMLIIRVVFPDNKNMSIGINTSVIDKEQIIDLVQQNYYNLRLKETQKILKESQYVDINCSFGQNTLFYKIYDLGLDGESIFRINFQFINNKSEIMFFKYLINSFDTSAKKEYLPIRNDYGKQIGEESNSYWIRQNGLGMKVVDVPKQFERGENKHGYGKNG